MTSLELAGYHDGLAHGELRAQRCPACVRFAWPPRPVCPHCRTSEPEWRTLPASASLYTWTVVGRTTLPAFADLVPYAVGVLEFPHEGIRMIGHVETPPGRLRIGLPMTWRVRQLAGAGPQAVWTIAHEAKEL